jgi:hypothetical protein
MAVPSWVVVYTVVIFLGLIAGLLFRFLLALVALVAALLLAIWLLGWVDFAALAQLPTLTGRVLAGLNIGPQVLFTIAAVVFLGGMFIGVLLTSRVRLSARAGAT